MPHFDDNPLAALAMQAGEADAELDLRGQAVDSAMARIEQLLAGAASERAALSYRIRFDAARGDGAETLFQPLGRRLLQARRDGVLIRCLPLPEGDAYFVVFAD